MTYSYDPSLIVLSYVNLLAAVLVLIAWSKYRGMQILAPASWYLVFHLFLFGVRPAVLFTAGYHTNFTYMRITPDVWSAVLTFLLANIALISFLGATLVRGSPNTPIQSRGPTPLEKQTYAIALIALSPLFLFSLYYGIQHPVVQVTGQSGGNLMTDPETGKKIFVQGSGYFYVLKNCIPGLILAHVILYRPNVYNISLTVVFIILAFLEGRGRFVIIYLILGFIIYYFQRPGTTTAKKSVVLGLFSLSAMVLISVGGIYRRVTRSHGSFDWANVSISDYLRRTPIGDSQEFGMYDFLLYLAKNFPDDRFGHTYFTQYLEVLTKPIPRALWPGKPIGSPVQLVDLNVGGNYDGLTQSMAGAGWLSLGLPGVIILSFLSGYVLQSVYCFATRNWNSYSLRSIYIVSLPFCIQWFRDGAPSIIEFYIFGLYPLIFWAGLMLMARGGYLKTKSSRGIVHLR
ncbi:O-antigen polymerase [Pseudoroseicyclus sp. H15]